MTSVRHGALATDWDHFDFILGLGSDLLPVVSNSAATISPGSRMQGLGKTPSRYNKSRQVAGIAGWTSHVTTGAEIKQWSVEPDYGICIQTRNVRAIDCDITDPQLAKDIYDEITDELGLTLPARRRAGASKFLLAFVLPGAYSKRVLKTAHGIVEYLADGQQFIACGTHPSGTRYEWAGGLPAGIPTLTDSEFESLWTRLEAKFAIEPGTTSNASVKAGKLADAAANDPTAAKLVEQGLVLGTEADGRLHISCPWEDEHTVGTGGESATTYWPANTGGYQLGHFKCLHASHADKSDRDFLEAIGLADDPRDDFGAIVPDRTPIGRPSARFTFVGDDVFSAGRPMGWIIKGVLPKAELGVVYGPPASGKSFWTLDMVMCVARGVPWCGKRVHRTTAGYIAAEGAGGVRNRIQAYREFHALPPEALIHILADVPNLLSKTDVVDLGNAIIRMGGFGILVYDTLARGTAGGDENSAQDMGLAIANCRTLHEVTGAMVLLVHHSGKDPSKGARGSNAILGAVDVEIEISRVDRNRTATISKLKDGEDGAQYGFVLKTVPIGMDEDGDVISSCVVEHGPVATPAPKRRKPGPREVALIAAARELQDELKGTYPSIEAVAEAARVVSGVRIDNLRATLMKMMAEGEVLESVNGGVGIVQGEGG